MVHTNKKFLLLLSFFMASNLLADQVVEDYSSGKIKLIDIMGNAETGIAAYNKNNIHYAETLNIAKDLNIEEIARFFNCKTVIGHKFMAETLMLPVSPQDKDSVLAKRQRAIQTLVENPALYQEVGKLLDKAKQEEQEVIKLLSEFFMGQNCPELKALALVKEQNPKLYPMMEFLHTNPTGKYYTSVSNVISLAMFSWFTYWSGGWTYFACKNNAPYGSMAFSTGYMGFLTGLFAYTTYKDYATGAEKRLKMHSLNQLITIAKEFETLCDNYSLESQFKLSAIKNENGKQMVEKLKHPRYQAKKMLFFQVPLVHAFLYKVYQLQKYLAEVFACVAEMDAYHAIATKIIESRETNNQFCFVTFLDSEKPVIQATGFWNVLVNNAVVNNLSEDKQIILTGPNAGGKTTAIRALLQNIVLGQTFGIAAASSCAFTIFDVIHAYLNVSDDILQGLSLFASEVKRAKEILQHIKALNSGKKFFFALDELFTGTAAEDGETCAYEFVKKIAAFDGIQFIYATHFDRLKKLGNEDKHCINYKVDAPVKNADGKLVYPFTLSQGANEARVALDIAREAHLFE